MSIQSKVISIGDYRKRQTESASTETSKPSGVWLPGEVETSIISMTFDAEQIRTPQAICAHHGITQRRYIEVLRKAWAARWEECQKKIRRYTLIVDRRAA